MRRYVFGFAMLAIASCLPMAAKADPQQDKQIAETVIQRLDTEKKAGRLKGFSIDLRPEFGRNLPVSGLQMPSVEIASFCMAGRFLKENPPSLQTSNRL